MRQLLRTFMQITLLRRGPQDLPGAPVVLLLTLLAFLAVHLFLNYLLPGVEGAGNPANADLPPYPVRVLLDALLNWVWFGLLLRFAGHPERTLQTTTAFLGVRTVLAPLLFLVSWAAPRPGQDSLWAAPALLFGLSVWIWRIAACSQIVKAALEWSGALSVALVLLQEAATELATRALIDPTG